ncbi:ferredoxin [Aquihabitans sp. G128]|uniref:ferredoxin n=1 Tax=Aquihabitans sp. G128 TaxID=2849779 RepID=UPI001C2462FA|nr:ferredoxin [Aquihabitans sp. G128]QXC60922.1 ferredoxin [Aquihabitans sp. G128]
MKITLDSEKCQGHGRCYALAPDLFDSDDEGYALLLAADGVVPEGMEEAATLAADNCPEYAITVEA